MTLHMKIRGALKDLQSTVAQKGLKPQSSFPLDLPKDT